MKQQTPYSREFIQNEILFLMRMAEYKQLGILDSVEAMRKEISILSDMLKPNDSERKKIAAFNKLIYKPK